MSKAEGRTSPRNHAPGKATQETWPAPISGAGGLLSSSSSHPEPAPVQDRQIDDHSKCHSDPAMATHRGLLFVDAHTGSVPVPHSAECVVSAALLGATLTLWPVARDLLSPCLPLPVETLHDSVLTPGGVQSTIALEHGAHQVGARPAILPWDPLGTHTTLCLVLCL